MTYTDSKEILTLEIGQAIEDGLTKAEMQTLNDKLGKTIKLYVDEFKNDLGFLDIIRDGENEWGNKMVIDKPALEKFNSDEYQVARYMNYLDISNPLAIVRLAGKIITGKYDVRKTVAVKAGDFIGWGQIAKEDGWAEEWEYGKETIKREMPIELEAMLLEVYDELAEISEMYLTLKNHILTPEQVKVRTENAKAEKQERMYKDLTKDFEALVVTLETRINDYQDYCVGIAGHNGLDLNNPIAVAQVSEGAEDSYKGFIMKMTQKIGQAVESAEFSEWSSTNPWEYTSMKIVTKTGETQVWTTNCIVNYSVYGKAFNQFPTLRRS